MKQHKYTHLGIAPYALVGAFYDPPVQDVNGAWHGGMNTCDHCGRPISYVFMCQSSDGKKFNLGSVHVEDLGDSGLTQTVRTKAKEMKKEVEAEKRRAFYAELREKERQVQEQLRAENMKKWEAVEAILPTLPHPNAYFASKGKTMKDYVEYCRFTKSHIISLVLQSGVSIPTL